MPTPRRNPRTVRARTCPAVTPVPLDLHRRAPERAADPSFIRAASGILMHMGGSVLRLIAAEQRLQGSDTAVHWAEEVRLLMQLLAAKAGALQQVSSTQKGSSLLCLPSWAPWVATGTAV